MQHIPARLSIVAACLAVVSAGAGARLTAQAGAAVATAPPRPARELVNAAVARVAAEDKTVLVKFSASWCGWCHKFDKFLEDTTGVGQIMRANFHVVGLIVLETPQFKALENPGGAELAKEMGGNLASTGIPFFFMLDATGKNLGNSNVMPDKSNIGMPDKPEEVAGFMDLLQRTAPRITSDERERIKAYLDRAAGRQVP